MRRPVIGILVMVMVLVLVSGAAALAARPKVTIATYSNPRYEIMRDVLVPKWQAKHPDIELEVIIFPDFWNKMLILMGTEMAPDIIDTAGTYLFGHVIRNGAVDLAPYLAKDDYLSENLFWPGPWNEVRWPQPDGAGIYGLPYDTVGSMLWYNPTILANAGVNSPTAAWNLDTLRTAARKITQDQNGDGVIDIWGMVVDLTHLVFDPLVKAYGGNVLMPDRKSSGLDSPEAAAATRFLADLVLQDRAAAFGGSYFLDSKAGFQIHGSHYINNVRAKPELHWDVAPMPRGPVTWNAYGGSNMWEVVRRPNQDMAAIMTIMRELITLETLEAFWTSYAVPYSLPSVRALASQMRRPSQIQQVLMESVAFMTDADWSPDWATWQTAKRTALTPVMTGEKSVMDGLLEAKHQIDLILDAAYEIGTDN